MQVFLIIFQVICSVAVAVQQYRLVVPFIFSSDAVAEQKQFSHVVLQIFSSVAVAGQKLKVFYVASLIFSCVAVAVPISDCPCFFIFFAVLQLQLLLNSSEKVLFAVLGSELQSQAETCEIGGTLVYLVQLGYFSWIMLSLKLSFLV